MRGLLEVVAVSVSATLIVSRLGLVRALPVFRRIRIPFLGRRKKMLRVQSWSCAPEQELELGEQEEWHAEFGGEAHARDYVPCCETFQKINESLRNRMVKRAANGELDVLLRPFCASVVNFCLVFDALGATFSQLVKSEMLTNVAKIEAACSKHGTKTMREMTDTESQLGVAQEQSAGTVALLWLKRSLQFVLLLVDNIVLHRGDDFSLTRCALQAYDDSLRAAHNFLVIAVFRAALLALPNRELFFARLGPSESLVRQDMCELLFLFRSKFEPIVDFFLESHIEKACVSRLELVTIPS
ncbi:Glycolipid transfer protein [Porphyridium purpureum]|uniref:Glycolipid transfer protein n=1 Tax=Porphyridium purpureum TaxID=35688 RepID=A0A5J4YYL5_PORPP|nr:Glycolipid transfer protein [Porphyridium purpureum]|eukprot:POR1281..scf209_3